MKTKSSRINFRGTFQTDNGIGSSIPHSGNSPSFSMVSAALPGAMESSRAMESSATFVKRGRFAIKKIRVAEI